MGRPFGKVDKQDLVGKKIGKLTVVEYAGKRNRGKIKYDYYLCKCECEKTNGNTIKVYKLNPNELDAYLKELKTKEVQYAGVRGW